MLIRFVDRDMMMRYRGGGVGHKSTRDATDWFLNDRDRLDVLTTAAASDDDADSELEPDENFEEPEEVEKIAYEALAGLEEDPNENLNSDSEDDEGTNDAEFEEEFDYGIHRDASDNEGDEEADEADGDALRVGPEDGASDEEDEDADFGYADL
jgi:hypothetical protein